MQATALTDLHFIDDSSDEWVLSGILLKKSRIALTLVTHPDFQDFMDALDGDDAFPLRQSILVMDLNLAVSSGLDAIRKIRANPALDGLVAGICTGSVDPADRRAALDAGADFFATKPLRGETLEQICADVPHLTMVTGDDQRTLILRHG